MPTAEGENIKNPICSACMLRYCRSGSDKKKVLLLQAQDNCAADKGVGKGKKMIA